MEISGADCCTRDTFYSDEEIHIRVGFRLASPAHDLRLILSLTDEENRAILTTQLSDDPRYIRDFKELSAGSYEATCVLPANLLGENTYYLTLHCIHPRTEHIVLRRAASFRVRFKGYNNILIGSFGEAYLRPQLPWQLEQR